MNLECNPVLPDDVREKINSYLKILKEDVLYPAFTINDKLEIVEGQGMISNNGSWNYHNNYDDSENEHYIIVGAKKLNKWFLLEKQDAIDLQTYFLKEWRDILKEELEKTLKLIDEV